MTLFVVLDDGETYGLVDGAHIIDIPDHVDIEDDNIDLSEAIRWAGRPLDAVIAAADLLATGTTTTPLSSSHDAPSRPVEPPNEIFRGGDTKSHPMPESDDIVGYSGVHAHRIADETTLRMAHLRIGRLETAMNCIIVNLNNTSFVSDELLAIMRRNIDT